jgi:hypothetical protein
MCAWACNSLKAVHLVQQVGGGHEQQGMRDLVLTLLRRIRVTLLPGAREAGSKLGSHRVKFCGPGVPVGFREERCEAR